MKSLPYKIKLFFALCTVSFTIEAQSVDKKYTEEFSTANDVLVDIDTRYTDVIIETWNKNKVEIEATISIEGANEKKKQSIINNWKFKALGNKSKVEITSKSEIDNIIKLSGDIHIIDSDIDLRMDDFVFPDISIENLAILDSVNLVVPDVIQFPDPIVIPEVDVYHFTFDSLPFDYEKYKKDKNYLKEWQEQMKQHMEKMNIEWKEQAVVAAENVARTKERLEEMQVERQKIMEERQKLLAERQKERVEIQKEIAKVRKEINERKREELAERRIEIKKILEERDKIKIKRIVRIKAPKDAKFNMNVKYGTISFAN
ncbi:MAG: hypothetical protein R2821_13495 [Flavobacteriaceae bacterium]